MLAENNVQLGRVAPKYFAHVLRPDNRVAQMYVT